jgi:hypothetical protein
MTSTADDTPERQQKVTRRELAEAIQTVTYEFSREHNYIPAGDAVSINSGHCRAFAENVLTYLGRPVNVELRSAGYYHTWLLHDGKHYDAECPYGVDDPSELPIWRRLDDGDRHCATDQCSFLSLARN